MVVDRSGSMQARDFVEGDTSVNRLDVVKQVFRDFVEKPGRVDDLIGLVTFARYADGACPLTGDHGNLLAILEQQQIVTDRAEDGNDEPALCIGFSADSSVFLSLSIGVVPPLGAGRM